MTTVNGTPPSTAAAPRRAPAASANRSTRSTPTPSSSCSSPSSSTRTRRALPTRRSSCPRPRSSRRAEARRAVRPGPEGPGREQGPDGGRADRPEGHLDRRRRARAAQRHRDRHEPGQQVPNPHRRRPRSSRSTTSPPSAPSPHLSGTRPPAEPSHQHHGTEHAPHAGTTRRPAPPRHGRRPTLRQEDPVLRSLFSGITGLRQHQTLMDVVVNNISNVNTAGFKSSSVVFEDTLSQMMRPPRRPTAARRRRPQPRAGRPRRPARRDQHELRQGSAQNTGKATDLMIQGDGFFVLATAASSSTPGPGLHVRQQRHAGQPRGHPGPGLDGQRRGVNRTRPSATSLIPVGHAAPADGDRHSCWSPGTSSRPGPTPTS